MEWRDQGPPIKVPSKGYVPPELPAEQELVDRLGRADLLVVGSHRHGAGPHIGSVSHGLIHHADGPVAVLGSGAAKA
jgi:nucleotide-binding universal stress UspA family protein